MKKFYLSILVSFYFCVVLIAAPIEPVRTMDVPYALNPPTMDGVADASYGPLQSTSIFNSFGLTGGDADFRGDFAVCWDNSYFYFISFISDNVEHIYNWDVGNSWEFDNLEIFFQLDTNTVTTAYGSSTAQLRVCRGLDSIESSGRARRIDFDYHMEGQVPGGWITEIAIPWTAIYSEGDTPEDILDYINQVIGFDVSMADSDNSDGYYDQGNRDVQAAWDEDGLDGTEDLAWTNTSVFGYIALSGYINNNSPVADAGPNQEVDEGTLVALDGTESYDSEGDPITYTWNTPAGISLSDIHSATPTFTAPEVNSNSYFQIGLKVHDGYSYSTTDYVTIEVNNINMPPVANAGADQTVNERELVMLNGSMSSDPEYQSLSYSWMSPQGVSFLGNTGINPLLIAPDVFEDESFQFVLTVNDGILDSEPDTINLNVTSLNDEYDSLVVYDTVYVVDVKTLYNTILISVVDDQGNLIAKEIDGNLYIELFPNPTDQFINIKSEMMISKIEILDAQGSVVLIETIDALTAELNLGGFAAGNYILRISSESGIVNKQLVLQ